MIVIQTIARFLYPLRYVLLCLAIAGALNASMDLTYSRFNQSVFSKFGHDTYFNPQISWPNKWALDAAGQPIHGVERFWESSRTFVAVTDWWHLAKTIMLALIMLAIVLYRRPDADTKDRAIDFVLCFTAFTGTFTIFYDCILVI